MPPRRCRRRACGQFLPRPFCLRGRHRRGGAAREGQPAHDRPFGGRAAPARRQLSRSLLAIGRPRRVQHAPASCPSPRHRRDSRGEVRQSAASGRAACRHRVHLRQHGRAGRASQALGPARDPQPGCRSSLPHDGRCARLGRRHGAAAAHVRLRNHGVAAAARPCISLVRRQLLSGGRAAALAEMPGGRMLVTTPLQIRALLEAGLPLPRWPASSPRRRRCLRPGCRRRGGLGRAGRGDFRGDRGGLDREPPHGRGRRLEHVPARAAAAGRPGRTRRCWWRRRIAAPFPLSDHVEPLEGARFRLLGRRTDLVKLGGRRASLAGLNRVLNGIEGVRTGVFVAPESWSRADRPPPGFRRGARTRPRRDPCGAPRADRSRVSARRVVRSPRCRATTSARSPQPALGDSAIGSPRRSDHAHGCAGQFSVPADHPCLPGHFPGRPVVPGRRAAGRGVRPDPGRPARRASRGARCREVPGAGAAGAETSR